MSQSVHMEAQQRNTVANVAMIVLALLVVAVFTYLLMGNSQRALSRSATGHDGFVQWLQSDQINIKKPFGLSLEADLVSLRILPLHDTDLETPFAAPEEREDYLKTGTEYDIRARVVENKLAIVRTLIIAPKWTLGARHSGYAHESLLLEDENASRPFRQLGLMSGDFSRPRAKLVEIIDQVSTGESFSVTLYAPQLFPRNLPDACEPVFGSAIGHLLISCMRDGEEVLMLSDPDLLNNHGLSLGQNAAFARAFFRPFAEPGMILLDTTTSRFLTPEPPILRKREWADLLRFFEYPFSLLWGALALGAALALWRSWMRVGPPDTPFHDQLGASKSVSIAAKARLMRMADKRAQIFEAYIQSRLRWLDQVLHGPHTAGEDQLRRIVGQIRRKDETLAQSFGAAAAAALSQHTNASPAALKSLADTFEAETEKVLYEFGRSPRPR